MQAILAEVLCFMPDDVTYYDPVVASARISGNTQRISWGAVWAGVMIALGMEVLFTLFGLFIGFGMYSHRAADPWGAVSHWSGLWYLVTTGWSMFFGAWCAAHLSGDPLRSDGMLHGITTWGLATAVTMTVLAIASWAVLREGIDVLGTAAIASERVAPGLLPGFPPGQIAPGTLGNTGQMAQA